MYARVIALAVVFLSLAVPVFTQSAPTLRDINGINGFDEMVEQLETSFRGALDRYPGPKPEPLVEAWKVAQEGAFDSARMAAELEGAMAAQLKPKEIAALLDYFKSDFGMRVSRLEIAATRPDVQQEKDAEGAILYADLEAKDPERLALYDRLIDKMQAVDVGEAIALNVAYAMVSAMLGASKQPATDEQIAAVVKQNAASLRANILDSITSSTAWTYRDLSLDDMRKYVAFLETPEAQRYYQAAMMALDRTLTDEARAFGNRLMIALGQRKA